MRYFTFDREKPLNSPAHSRSLDEMTYLSLFVMFSRYDQDN